MILKKKLGIASWHHSHEHGESNGKMRTHAVYKEKVSLQVRRLYTGMRSGCVGHSKDAGTMLGVLPCES